MVNAHATLLYQICVRDGWQDNVPCLEKMVKAREGLLRWLMDR